MDRLGERVHPEAIVRGNAFEDVRSLVRKNMRYRDLAGLAGLMDDYLALGDELEEVPTTSQTAQNAPTGVEMKAARANDGDTLPASTTRAA
jgi:hypothetical protein